jgi:hypothetical protein
VQLVHVVLLQTTCGPMAHSSQTAHCICLTIPAVADCVQGWLGMSFPQQAGRMYPAMAVLGAKDAASGNPKVTAYQIKR